MTDNIISLPGQYNELVANLENLKRNLEILKEFKALDAELKWKHYEALISEGFAPEQALYIISKG